MAQSALAGLDLRALPRHQADDFMSAATPSVTRALGHWKAPEALRVWKMNKLITAARENPQVIGAHELENLSDDGRALLIGSLVHKVAETLPPTMEGLLGPEALLDPEVASLAKSYAKFRSSPWGSRLKLVESEVPLAGIISVDNHAIGVLTGHADIIVQAPEGLSIIDWKSSKRPSITHAYQVSCYSRLYGPVSDPDDPDVRYPEALVVYLSKTHKRGKFRVFRCTGPMWAPVVLGALNWYDHPYLPDWEEIHNA